MVAVLVIAAGLVARALSRLSARWFGKGDAPRMSIPVSGAVVIGGLLLVIPELAVPGRLGHWLVVALTLAFVLACALSVSRLAVAGVTTYAVRHPSVTPALGVVRVAVRLGVGVLAVITALESLGVPVAPLLTTLGVSSLAVALALQETLANFFAGLYLLADRPVRAGDYIKIHDGEEGYVETIGWRSSRLRTLKNNVVIVPNQKLSQAIITNFHLPAPPVGMIIPVTVAYDADPSAVEAQLSDEVARAAGEIPELHFDGSGAPTVRLTDFGESGMVFQVGVQVRNMEAQGTAAHELRKRILARLRGAGIEIPLPQRVVHQAGDRGAGATDGGGPKEPRPRA
jgi:small-conductance mechanosensitive channel